MKDLMTTNEREIVRRSAIVGMEDDVERWARRVLVDSAVLSLAMKGLLRLGVQDGEIFTVIQEDNEPTT
jgi:hypothetical protein